MIYLKNILNRRRQKRMKAIFFTRDVKINETADEYITALRELSATCNFGELTDSLVKDRLVNGTKSQLEVVCAEIPKTKIEGDGEDVLIVRRGQKPTAKRMNRT